MTCRSGSSFASPPDPCEPSPLMRHPHDQQPHRLFIYPFSYGIGLTFQPYVAVFKDSFVFDSVYLTMRLALPAALFNVLASLPMAFKLRHRFRGKKLLTTLLVLPITLGTVLTAQGLLIFAGRQGWLNRFLLQIGVIDQPLTLVNNYLGVMFSLVISGFPFAFLLISSYLSGIDPSIEAAAKTCLLYTSDAADDLL